MSWLEPISAAVTGASLVNQLAKGSTLIKKYAHRIINQILHGSVLLPIFGAGGVGKTTAGKILVGDDPLDVGTPYNESWTIEPQELGGDLPGQILVGPGQPERVERYWPNLISAANTGKSSGIINVVCYGLHSFGIDSYTEHDLYQDGMTPDEFMSQYTSLRREEELAMLDKLLNTLAPAQRQFFFVTLVTKQDLWWHQKQEIKNYYTRGPYCDRIEKFRSTVGSQRFHHEFVPASLTVANFSSPSGELMWPTAQGYDHTIHMRYLQCLFDKLHDLVEKHLRSN